MNNEYDITIVGSGPGGVASALSLFCGQHPDYKVALVDKSLFPREKVCGDAIPSWIFKDLEEVCPGIHERFLSQIEPPLFRKTKLVLSKTKSFTVEWTGPGYMVPRIELDNFLLNETKGIKGLDVLNGINVKEIKRESDRFVLYDEAGNTLMTSRFIVGADGAPSTVVRNLLPIFRTKATAGTAVRTYYKNLNISEPEVSRIYYSKKYAPGYFWVFPIGSNRANLGFGMISKERQKRNINLKEAFAYFIEEFPGVGELIAGGEAEEDLKGGFLPFSKGVGRLLGKGFALVGDAANLNDPLSGDGIRNAVISGIHLGKSLAAIDDLESYNSLLLTDYRSTLKSRLHKDLRFRSRIVKISTLFRPMVPLIVSLANWKWLSRLITKWL